MPDRIIIEDLLVRCILGVNGDERDKEQDVVIQIQLFTDQVRKAAASDDIADTIDYKAVKQRAIALAKDSRFNLIETLADAIAAMCLQDHRVQRAVVRCDKPGALRFARTVAVEVDRP